MKQEEKRAPLVRSAVTFPLSPSGRAQGPLPWGEGDPLGQPAAERPAICITRPGLEEKERLRRRL